MAVPMHTISPTHIPELARHLSQLVAVELRSYLEPYLTMPNEQSAGETVTAMQTEGNNHNGKSVIYIEPHAKGDTVHQHNGDNYTDNSNHHHHYYHIEVHLKMDGGGTSPWSTALVDDARHRTHSGSEEDHANSTDGDQAPKESITSVTTGE